VKHPWGKGNQFYINEYAGPPEARGRGPIGEIGVCLLKTTPQEWFNRM